RPRSRCSTRCKVSDDNWRNAMTNNDDDFEDLYKDLPADEREYMQRYHKPDGVCFHCRQPANQHHPVDPSRSRSPTGTATRARTNFATGNVSATGPLAVPVACSSYRSELKKVSKKCAN